MKYLLGLMMSVASVVAAAPPPVVPSADARFQDRETRIVPDFQRHVVPLLGRLGCNSAKCHGSFQGQADFRLSLFGFDFAADHAALVAEATTEEGMRISADAPEQSLILLKATAQIDHEGGQRFKPGSWEHHLLLRWIESGAKGVEAQAVASTEVVQQTQFSPQGIRFFEQKIEPLFEKNCYECHGFNNRKGNLQLKTRELLLAGGDSGPAITPGDPEGSLLVQAVRHRSPDLRMPPQRKLADGQIADLEAWVRMGAPWRSRPVASAAIEAKVLVQLHCEPQEILFSAAGDSRAIRVVAQWEDGRHEDVTCLTRFRSNDDAVVTIDAKGLAHAVGPGDTHIVAFYDNGVLAIPVLRPYSKNQSVVSLPENVNPVDRLVLGKLSKLGLRPSALCDDAEFLRRVSIDVTGTLPAPDEVTAFLMDDAADKRERKINELLNRPAYAAWWTNKLCDFTGCSPSAFGEQTVLEVGHSYSTQWYDWIHRRVASNMPYDQLVAGIVLAQSRGPDQSREDYATEMSSYVRQESPADFSLRKTMPHYWTRATVSEAKDKALAFAHSFLGIQLQCAECHKHPFDKWTQSDFSDFTRFFEDLTARGRMGFPAFAAAQRGKIVNWPELSVGKGADKTLGLLRSGQVTIAAGEDPRAVLMKWMREQDNPWFARAFVNRVWAGYFHVGIVEPPDQFTPANPPSNPQLLDWLTRGFLDSAYDMKWLHRQITRSATYQRSWKPNATNRQDRRNFSRAIPRRIPAEVIYDAMKQATAATEQLDAVRANLKRRASGHLSMRMAGTHAMKVFGKPARAINCDCERVNEPTLLQAIFVQNDPLVRMRLADSGWIIQIEEAVAAGRAVGEKELVKQVWLRTVNRLPDEDEIARAVKHLASVDSIVEGVTDLMWAMLNTKEFLLNH